MRSLIVVDVNELINKPLEFADRARCGSRCDPFLQCLLETFNLAGRGRVAGPSVFLGDAEFSEAGFELVASALPASETNRVHQSIIGEHRGWQPIVFSSFVESVSNDVPRQRADKP